MFLSVPYRVCRKPVSASIKHIAQTNGHAGIFREGLFYKSVWTANNERTMGYPQTTQGLSTLLPMIALTPINGPQPFIVQYVSALPTSTSIPRLHFHVLFSNMYRDVRLEYNSDLETRVDIIHGSRLLDSWIKMTSKLVMTIEIQPWRGNYEIQTFACETRLFAFHHHHSKHRPPRGRRGRREDCRRCSISKVLLWVDLSRATSTSINGDQQGDHTKSSYRIDISSEINIRELIFPQRLTSELKLFLLRVNVGCLRTRAHFFPVTQLAEAGDWHLAEAGDWHLAEAGACLRP